jgi:patatin-like phospholipase/acyl hydrolase
MSVLEGTPMNQSSPTVKILALDGGGLRAAFSLSILTRLEAVTKRPLHDVFDVVIGTSTGAILAFAIGHRKLSALECLSKYRELGAEIFPTGIWDTIKGKWRDMRHGAYWDAATLERSLQDLFGSSTTLSTLKNGKPQVVCIAAECSRSPGGVVVFSTYPRENMPFAGTDDVKIWQAIRASTAAPTFFDYTELRDSKLSNHYRSRQFLLDGGLLANNPALVGLIETKKAIPDRAYTLVSIGTGTAKSSENIKAQFWSTSLRVALNTAMSDEVVDAAMRVFLPGNYFRINGELGRVEEMDDYEHFEYWRQEGETTANSYSKWDELEKVLSF